MTRGKVQVDIFGPMTLHEYDSPEMRRKLTRDNATALYGLGGS